MAAMHLIRPVGRNKQEVTIAEVPQQKAEQLAGGTVSPVEILYDEDERLTISQSLKQNEGVLEQAHAAGIGLEGLGNRRAELRQETSEDGIGALDQPSHSGRAELSRETPQRAGDRGEGQPLRTKLQTRTGEHPGASFAHLATEFLH
jgi:hypothetical protein